MAALGTHQFIENFSLAYHLRVVEKLRLQPQETLAIVSQNLLRWRESGHLSIGELKTLLEWEKIVFDSSVTELALILSDNSSKGKRLRQSSPFIGILTKEERLGVLAACEEGTTLQT